MTQPTQTRHPGRATLRTVVAAAVSLLSLLPLVLAGAHLDGTWIATQVIAVSAGVTRVLAIPAANAWVTEYLPWLAPTPRRP